MKSLSMTAKVLALGAAVVGFAYGAQAKTWYVTQDALDGGAGTSWDTPISLAAALDGATGGTAETEGDEILLKAGDYTLTAAISTSKALTIRGGYAGEGTTLDAVNPYSVLSGGQTLEIAVTLTVAQDLTTELERVVIRDAKKTGLKKTGAGALSLVDCRIEANGFVNASGITGCGAYFESGVLTMTNCAVRGNVIYNNTGNLVYGTGIYLKNLTRAYLDDCSFVTNGMPTASYGSGGAAQETFQGAAIYATASPVTCRGCSFVGNRGAVHAARGDAATGGIVHLDGNCNGSAFTNCVWKGNVMYCGSGSSGASGAGATGMLVLKGSSVTTALDVDSCTFAYNIVNASASPAALNVYKGAAKVRNSIFYGNILRKATAYGADLHVSAEGSADVDTCVFASGTIDNITFASANALAMGPDNVFGDPRFVTDLATFAADVNGGVSGSTRSVNTGTDLYIKKTADVCSYDLHLRSTEGHWTPDGLIKDDEISPMIGRGAYAGTAQASVRPTGTPALGTVEAVQADEDRLVHFTIPLAGTDDYIARVKLRFGAAVGVWDRTVDFGLQLRGAALTASTGKLYPKGTTLYYEIVLDSEGREPIVVPGTFLIEKDPPEYYGHGGDPATVAHVWADAPGNGSGDCWANAHTTLAAALDAIRDDTAKTEIWIAEDLTMSESCFSKTVSHKLMIRGGFAVTNDAASARAPGRRSVLSGGQTQDILNIANSAAVEIERVNFTDSFTHSLTKTGAGDLTLRDCDFLSGGWNTPASEVFGYGLNATGTSAANLTITNCVFADNGGRKGVYGHKIRGAGAYISTFKRVTIDDTQFLTNGIAVAMIDPSGYPVSQEAGYGWAFAVNAAPVTMRNSTVIGNRGTQHNSSTRGIVYFEGKCDGTAFTNCVFAGNCVKYNANSSTTMGTLVFNSANAADGIDVVNCTFAYNLIQSKASTAGFNLQKGRAKVRNTIFYGNLAQSATAYGSDLHVATTATADLDYCFFADETTDCITEATPGLITWGDPRHNRTGDPLFATTMSDIVLMMNGAPDEGSTTRSKSTKFYYKKEADFSTIDVHLRSSTGRWSPEDYAFVSDEKSSTAIDGGDESDYAKEQDPNGGCINMGAYGNTAEASKSPVGKPADPVVSIAQDVDYSQPFFRFSLDGTGDFLATVTLKFGSTDAGEGEWEHVSVLSPSAAKGDAFDAGAKMYFLKGDVVHWRVEVSCPNGIGLATGQFTVESDPPAWFGKGDKTGKAIHVWEGATLKGDGSTWADAFTSLNDALEAFKRDETKDEIWFAGTNAVTKTIPSRSVTHALVLRGGFTAMEDTAAERPAGRLSVLDGCMTQNPFTIVNSAAVEIERVNFTRARVNGLVKTGAGDLTLRDCRFYDNHHSTDAVEEKGYGVRAEGTASSVLRIENCLFDRNQIRTGVYQQKCYGCAAYVSTFARVYLDNVSFMTNGANPSIIVGDNAATSSSHNGPCQEGFTGSAVYATAAPVTARGCRFVGNRGFVHQGSGNTVQIGETSGACAFSNCLFLANSAQTHNWYKEQPTAGALYFGLSSAETPIDIVNCTFAYGLYSGQDGSAALSVVKGAAKVKNSIFFANLTTRMYPANNANTSASVADILAGATASVNIDHCLFAEREKTFSRTARTGGTLEETDCVYGDPLLVTSLAEMTNCILKVDGYSTAISNTYHIAGHPVYHPATDYAALNAHLRTRCGYTDETTGEVVRCPVNSPAIDAGDPESDFSREAQPNGHRVNLGFYGNTPWASMSPGGCLLILLK